MEAFPVLPYDGSERQKALLARFKERFGKDASFVVRTPGRVNLIGEHVDYSGFSVVPMAIEDHTLIAVGLGAECEGDDVISLSNVDPQWPDHAYRASQLPSQPLSGSLWTHYVAAGLLNVSLRLKLSLPPLRLLVDGRVPTGSGLSSSSAMCCAGALTALRALGGGLSPSVMASVAAEAERLLGMESGGMDQAICLLAQPGCALHIQFDPVRTAVVTLPDSAVVVIIDSGVQSLKYASAATGYNLRVVECRFASAIVAKHLGVTGVRTLRQLLEKTGKTLSELLGLLRKHLREGPYSLADVQQQLGPDADAIFGNASVSGPYLLLDRSLHVAEESLRVARFVSSGVGAEELGALMNASHHSLARLFGCSCEELDALTAHARLSGALGSRLTGAGWGGWTVHLVPKDKVAAFCESMKEYLAKHVEDERRRRIVVSQPARGANYFE